MYLSMVPPAEPTVRLLYSEVGPPEPDDAAAVHCADHGDGLESTAGIGSAFAGGVWLRLTHLLHLRLHELPA